jgi:putative endonuclease
LEEFEIMNYVYVLKSEKDGRFYVGMTQDLANRLKEHNSGRTRSTKGYQPWVIIHEEIYPDRKAARKREKYLKSGYGKQWLKSKYNSVP